MKQLNKITNRLLMALCMMSLLWGCKSEEPTPANNTQEIEIVSSAAYFKPGDTFTVNLSKPIEEYISSISLYRQGNVAEGISENSLLCQITEQSDEEITLQIPENAYDGEYSVRIGNSLAKKIQIRPHPFKVAATYRDESERKIYLNGESFSNIRSNIKIEMFSDEISLEGNITYLHERGTQIIFEYPENMNPSKIYKVRVTMYDQSEVLEDEFWIETDDVQIHSITPLLTGRGNWVTIAGQGFYKRPDVFLVDEEGNETEVRLTKAFHTEIQFRVPLDIERKSYKIKVIKFPDVDPVTSNDELTVGFVPDAPEIHSISHESILRGEKLTIKGARLGKTDVVTHVLFLAQNRNGTVHNYAVTVDASVNAEGSELEVIIPESALSDQGIFDKATYEIAVEVDNKYGGYSKTIEVRKS